jgi:hypothetical protein
MIGKVNFLSLGMTGCNQFSIQSLSVTCYSVCFDEAKVFFEPRKVKSDERFVMKNQEGEGEDEEIYFVNESESESEEENEKKSCKSEVESFRQFLSLSCGSSFGSGSRFSKKKSNSSISIDSSI